MGRVLSPGPMEINSMENGTKGRVKQGLLFRLTEVSGRLHEFQNIDITLQKFLAGFWGTLGYFAGTLGVHGE